MATNVKLNGHGAPPLAEQVRAWLAESCLTEADLPGVLNVKRAQRTIELYDIQHNRIPEGDVVRQFAPTNGFGALVNPQDLPKYIHPPDQPPHLLYPQNTSYLPQPWSWAQWAQDPAQRKVFGEGWKKVAAAVKFGIPAVGIEGCWGWRAVKHGYLMLPEFKDYQLNDCDVYWVPDRDRKPKAVADIARASSAFALVMQECGTRFHVVWLPLLEGCDKVGLDDFLFHYSRGGKDVRAARKAFEDLLASTPVWKDYELTDLGNSQRFVAMYHPQFRYVGRAWYTYQNGCWVDDVTLKAQEAAKDMLKGLQQDALYAGNSERLSYLKAQHASAQRVEQALKLSRSDPSIAAARSAFDCNRLWVNCPNGVLAGC